MFGELWLAGRRLETGDHLWVSTVNYADTPAREKIFERIFASMEISFPFLAIKN